MVRINVFDFDNTLYDGESTLDFYLFCVKHHPKLLKYAFVIFYALIKYKLCIISEDELMGLAEKHIGDFLRECPDSRELAVKFWDKNKRKLKPFYQNVKAKDDTVLSASFDFLLETPCKMLGIKHLVCSSVDFDTGKVKRLCFKNNKVGIFKEYFKDKEINDFYTDSMNDEPIMRLAKGRVFLVRKNKITLLCERNGKFYEK